MVRVLFTAVLKKWTSLGAPLTPLILVLFSVLVFYVWEEPWRKGSGAISAERA